MTSVVVRKNKIECIIFLVVWGLRAGSIGFAVGAISHLEQGKYGVGLVNAGLCLLYLLVASTDLGKLWDSRNMNPMAVARADPPTIKFMSGAILFHILFIGGIVIQCFE